MIGNYIGPAQGIWLEIDDKLLVALPGPPRENRTMFDTIVLPRIVKSSSSPSTRTLTIAGLAETEVHEILAPIIEQFTELRVSIFPAPWEIRVSIFSNANQSGLSQDIQLFIEKTRISFGDYLASLDGETIAPTFCGCYRRRYWWCVEYAIDASFW
jgi:molybdopterin-biosynthesis enzyme MoeA-like protein